MGSGRGKTHRTQATISGAPNRDRYKNLPDHLIQIGALAVVEKKNSVGVHEFHLGVFIDLWQKEPVLVQAEGPSDEKLAYTSHALGSGFNSNSSETVVHNANGILETKEKEGYKVPSNYMRIRFRSKEIKQALALALWDPKEMAKARARNALNEKARREMETELNGLEPLNF